MSIDKKLEELKIQLPEARARGGIYTPIKLFAGGKLAYCSGFGPEMPDWKYYGKLGREVSEEQGQLAARNCILNLLAAYKRDIGSLDQIESFVKMLVFVASDINFTKQPAVANGATELLAEIFGKASLPARSAIGVCVLPGNIPVEVELLLEQKLS